MNNLRLIKKIVFNTKALTLLLSITTQLSLQSCVQKSLEEIIIDKPCTHLIELTVVDKELKGYVQSFVFDAMFFKRSCLQLNAIIIVDDAQFSSLMEEKGSEPSTTVGYCDFLNKAIYIKRSYWDLSSNASKKALTYHELGHCVLGLTHKEGISLLNPNMLPSYIYSVIWWQLVVDMFKQEPNIPFTFN